MMVENVVVGVLRADAKIYCVRRVPLVFHFYYFKGAPAQGESYGALVGSISGVAFDSHFAHRCLRDRRLRCQRSEEHTSELQSPDHLVCRLLLEKKKK